MAKLETDPITVEIIRNAMIAAAQEMKISLAKTSYNPIIYEVLDFSVGILNREGEMLAQVPGLPVFLGNLGDAIRTVVDDLGYEAITPGDVFIINDPYAVGTHLTDVTIFAPIFHGDELLGFAATRAHWIDIGGHAPGGWFTDTTEVYQEGLRFRSIKLYNEGKPNEDILRMIKSNIRHAESVLGDMQAQIASCRTGERRFVEIIEKYGKRTVFESIAQIMDQSELKVRESIRKIPNGSYVAQAFLDGDGVEKEELRVKVKTIVEDDEMNVDLSESEPELSGPMNCGWAATIAAVRMGFKAITTPDDPVNEGSFRPLKIELPLGTMFSATEPNPVSQWIVPICTLTDVFLKSLAPALPEDIPAAHYGDVCATFIYGIDPRNGKPYVHVEPEGGGWGASFHRDGESMLIAILDGDTKNVPVEVVEARYPLRIERYELRRDSGGPGKYRGGLGAIRNYRILNHSAQMTVTYERSKQPPWGLFGGEQGATNGVVLFNSKSEEPVKIQKATRYPLPSGTLLSTRTGGGGGWGDPLERDPRLVKEDVMDGYVSPEAAREDYGVVLDPQAYEVNWEATEELRRELRANSRLNKR